MKTLVFALPLQFELAAEHVKGDFDVTFAEHFLNGLLFEVSGDGKQLVDNLP